MFLQGMQKSVLSSEVVPLIFFEHFSIPGTVLWLGFNLKDKILYP